MQIAKSSLLISQYADHWHQGFGYRQVVKALLHLCYHGHELRLSELSLLLG